MNHIDHVFSRTKCKEKIKPKKIRFIKLEIRKCGIYFGNIKLKIWNTDKNSYTIRNVCKSLKIHFRSKIFHIFCFGQIEFSE